MERADFIHLVRISEQASADDSAAYRRNLALFVALGFAWVIGCFTVASWLLYWSVNAMLHNRFKVGYVLMLIASASLLYTSLRALWCKFDPPEGVELTPSNAPALFEALERIRKKIKGPPLHHVWLNDDFNASISQLPRFGLFGGAVNHLSVGLPLLLAVDRPRFLAVLAHEYGHLRGDHGRFAAWIYRTRLSWARMEEGLRHDEGIVGILNQTFLRWYFPRFAAKTFALARQDEYEADRIAGKLLGRDVTGAALVEIQLKGAWLSQEFWREHWTAAAQFTQPIGPYAALRRLLVAPLPDAFARSALRQSLQRLSSLDDTHPVLRDRLEALELKSQLPEWSTKSALNLLGDKGAHWLGHFDKIWCREHASEWKQHHAYMGRLQARVDKLQAELGSLNADQCADLGKLLRRLNARAPVREHFERAVQLNPQHGAGLRGLIDCLEPHERAERVDYLTRLHDHCLDYRWWACNAAVSFFEQPSTDGQLDLKALSLWRERLKAAKSAEDRAWEELTDEEYFTRTANHDLNESEREELQVALSHHTAIARAWLVRKNLREFASRRAYLLFVELPQIDESSQYEICRNLERTLDLPGPVLVLYAGPNPTLEQIERQIRSAVYIRQATPTR